MHHGLIDIAFVRLLQSTGATLTDQIICNNRVDRSIAERPKAPSSVTKAAVLSIAHIWCCVTFQGVSTIQLLPLQYSGLVVSRQYTNHNGNVD
jgi:hypothetical protein